MTLSELLALHVLSLYDPHDPVAVPNEANWIELNTYPTGTTKSIVLSIVSPNDDPQATYSA